MTLRDELRSFKRERIIQEAQRLFYERGYRGTSLDAVAEALDMTKPFVYAVYARKVDILVEISMRTLQRSLDTLRQARADGGSPTAQLQRFAMRFTEVVIRHQAGSAVFFREEASIPADATRRINRLKGEFDDELAALLEAGRASGEFRIDDVRTATLAIGGMISWVYVWFRSGGRLSPAVIGEHMAQYTLRIAGAEALALPAAGVPVAPGPSVAADAPGATRKKPSARASAAEPDAPRLSRSRPSRAAPPAGARRSRAAKT